MDIQEQQALMDAASEYTSHAAEVLGEKLGRSPNEQEMVIFGSTVSSMMGSWVYAQIFGASGLEGADTWMQQVFAQLSMGVKTRGVPVTLQISLKSMPTGPQKVEATPPVVHEAKPPVVICKCVLDDKGHCFSCTQKLEEDLTQLIKYMQQIEGFQKAFTSKTEQCQPCVNKGFDEAFAKVIRCYLKNLSPESQNMMVAMAIQGASQQGVTQIPRIEQALAELQQA